MVGEEDRVTRCTGTRIAHRNTKGRFMATKMPSQHAGCKKSSLLQSRRRWVRSVNLVDWFFGDKLGSSLRNTWRPSLQSTVSTFSTSSSMDQSWSNYMCTVSSHTKQYILENKTVVAILRYWCNNVVHCSVGGWRFSQKCDKGHNLSVCDLQKAWPFTFIWFWVYLWKNMLSFRNFALEGGEGVSFPQK